jgi:hypothetical protein
VSTLRLSIILLTFIVLYSAKGLKAQRIETREVVQFSGIVIGENNRQLPGVHIYVPKSGRGTTSNMYGYFSMPLLEGDTVVFSSVGYTKYNLVIPEGMNRINVEIALEVDITYLENVDILPFLSEENFKEAILAMELPNEEELLKNRLDGEVIAMMIQSAPYDAALNARYYLNQQMYYQQDKFMPRTNPFLNPFNWSRFIQSLKKK